MKILSGLVVGLTLITFIIMPEPASSRASCDATEVYRKCVETASENHKNGTYSDNLYLEFVNDHCRDSGRSCLE